MKVPPRPALALAFALLAGAAQADLPRESAVPGGVVLIDIAKTTTTGTAAEAPPAVTFDGKLILETPSSLALKGRRPFDLPRKASRVACETALRCPADLRRVARRAVRFFV